MEPRANRLRQRLVGAKRGSEYISLHKSAVPDGQPYDEDG